MTISSVLRSVRVGLVGILVLAALAFAVTNMTERTSGAPGGSPGDVRDDRQTRTSAPTTGAAAEGHEPGGAPWHHVPAGTLDPAGARAALDTLTVVTPGDSAGYDRDCGRGDGCVFGPAWTDAVTVEFGHNGCDTRNDILRRDFNPDTLLVRDPAHPCTVIGGTLHDPYTGQTLVFDPDRPAAIQIDHVVALAAAWRAGARDWTPTQRQNFANDPHNLLAVDGTTNQQKGDDTIDQWAPRQGYICSYTRIIISVKATYRLTVSPAEKEALADGVAQCVTEPAPAGGGPR